MFSFAIFLFLRFSFLHAPRLRRRAFFRLLLVLELVHSAGRLPPGQCAGNVVQPGVLFVFVRLRADRAPERSRDDVRRFGQRQSLNADQIIEYVSDDLGIRFERAFVAEHLDETAVRVVRRDLAVVTTE